MVFAPALCLGEDAAGGEQASWERLVRLSPSSFQRQGNPMIEDAAVAAPEAYKVVFENERVRVLELRMEPAERTEPHGHPDMVVVMVDARSHSPSPTHVARSGEQGCCRRGTKHLQRAGWAT